jgi:hypothetical protein
MSSSRIVRLFNQGEVRLFEASTNGDSKVTLKAPAALAADIAVILPSSLPAGTQLLVIDTAGQIASVADGSPGEFLTTDGTGSYSWGVAASSLQLAYNGGATIDSTSGAVGISANATSNALEVVQSGAGKAVAVTGGVSITGNSTLTGTVDITSDTTIGGDATISGTLDVTGDITGSHIGLTNTSTHSALGIIQSTPNQAVFIRQDAVGSAGLKVVMNATGSTSYGIEIDSSISSNTSPALWIHNSASNSKQVKIEKTDGGTGGCVEISSNGTSEPTVKIISANTTSVNCIALGVVGSGGSTCIALQRNDTNNNDPIITITNSGGSRNKDIQGHGSSWHIRNNGAIKIGVMSSSNRPASPDQGLVIWDSTVGGLVVYTGAAWAKLTTTST